MIVYPASKNPANAIYFDNEGHIIQYSVYVSENKKTLTFISDSLVTAPRFRLTYTAPSSDSLLIKFELAPPGKPNEFSTYLAGTAHRIKSDTSSESMEKEK